MYASGSYAPCENCIIVIIKYEWKKYKHANVPISTLESIELVESVSNDTGVKK